MYQHKFLEIQKAHDQLLIEIAEKAANQKTAETNLMKLQNSYDSLLIDFKYIQFQKCFALQIRFVVDISWFLFVDCVSSLAVI